jgi:hypothetical protein
VGAPSHHEDHATVHGRVETEDSKGSTWISSYLVIELAPRMGLPDGVAPC